MKFDDFKEKTAAVYHKIGKKAVITTAAVVVVGVTVALNFILWGAAEDTAKTPVLDLSDLSASVGDDTAAPAAQSTFAEMILSRTQARDEAIEVLNGVINSDTAVDEMKSEAQAEIGQIAKNMESEANIETLVKSKGFEECVAVISGDSVNVIVDCENLTQSQVSQISEIVYEQAGILPANLRIIEG